MRKISRSKTASVEQGRSTVAVAVSGAVLAGAMLLAGCGGPEPTTIERSTTTTTTAPVVTPAAPAYGTTGTTTTTTHTVVPQ